MPALHRFVYLTDTHLGADASGYQMQPRYAEQNQQLLRDLADWLLQEQVEFVIHGGDLTDHGTLAEIDRAAALPEQLGVPVYLCLGNHDLAQGNSLRQWCSQAPELLPRGADCYDVQVGPARVVVVHHHWHDHVAHHWQSHSPQQPRLDEPQLAQLDELISASSGPVIAVTHAPVHAVPAAQCGQPQDFHAPEPTYQAAWRQLAATHRHLRLVLTGHNHVTSHHDHGHFISCTTAAFNELPAQVRLITVSSHSIEVKTIALAQALGLPSKLPAATRWTAGTPADQLLQLMWR